MRLVLTFGIICLLQGLSGEPRPEFGLTNTISGSDRMTLVRNAASTIPMEIMAISAGSLISGYGPLNTLNGCVAFLTIPFGNLLNFLFDGYDKLLVAKDGNIAGAFSNFETAISSIISYISVGVSGIRNQLRLNSFPGIDSQLEDAYGRIAAGLLDLKSKSTLVREALIEVYNIVGSATVSADILRKHLPMKLVYDMVHSFSNFRAFLPLVTYILNYKVQNLKEADSYFVRLRTALSTDVTVEGEKLTTYIEKIISQIQTTVESEFSGDKTNAQTAADISSLTNIKTATQYAGLIAAANTLSGLFAVDALAAQTSTMKAAFSKITSSSLNLINRLQRLVILNTNVLLRELIYTLLDNVKYGRYCFNKYKDLVHNMFEQSFNSAWLCVNNEYERLDYLKITLDGILELMAYDYEDFLTQVKVCESINSSPTNLNSCVTALANFYTEVFKMTTEKITIVYKLATDEAVASENRLLMCFQLVFIDGINVQQPKIQSALRTCSTDGPAGSD
uniref:Protein TsetseEP domain-containing protein n=1 Tax=Anopheles epiroticus TaxID=199890 RepID=A0A182P3K4_9DIPT